MSSEGWPALTSLELREGGPGKDGPEPNPGWTPGRPSRALHCQRSARRRGCGESGWAAWDAAMETHVQVGRGGGREEPDG